MAHQDEGLLGALVAVQQQGGLVYVGEVAGILGSKFTLENVRCPISSTMLAVKEITGVDRTTDITVLRGPLPPQANAVVGADEENAEVDAQEAEEVAPINARTRPSPATVASHQVRPKEHYVFYERSFFSKDVLLVLAIMAVFTALAGIAAVAVVVMNVLVWAGLGQGLAVWIALLATLAAAIAIWLRQPRMQTAMAEEAATVIGSESGLDRI